MVQLPINVYPDNNITLDRNSEENETRVSFTFKGDNLKAYAVRFFDYETGQLAKADSVIYSYDTELMQYNPLAYNNDTVYGVGLLSNLNPVGSYIMQFMIIGGLTNSGGVATDRFVLRGEVQEAYTSGSTSFIVENQINSIYEWDFAEIKKPITVVNSGITYYLNIMSLKIGGESQKIISYNYTTGEITLESGLTNDYPIGTPYQIYCNYIITPQYYFNLATRPQIVAMNAEWNAYGVKFSAVYSQAQYHFLKYYTITMQKKTDSGVYYDVAKTGKRYSQKIEYTFVDDYDYYVDVAKAVANDEQRFALTTDDINLGDVIRQGQQYDKYKDKYYYVSDISNLDNEKGYSKFCPLFGGNDNTRIYRFVVNAIGQDGTDITAYSEDFIAPERETTVKFTRINPPKVEKWNNAVRIDFDGNLISNGIRVYRIEGKNISQYGSFPHKTLIGDFWGSGAFVDYTASTHGEYVYMFVPYYSGTIESTEINRAVLSDKIITSEYGYTITAIHDSGKDVNGLPFFLLGDTWKFITDIDDTTVVQNTDKTLHSGFGKYSSLTSTQTDFMTGTVSAGIGSISCPDNTYNDTIEMVRAWRKFITQDCQFILRSQKGDVWVVNITENPSTIYQENVPQLFTTVEFNWAECCNINEIITGISEPARMQER